MATKKIRWTKETLFNTDLRKLNEMELRRAYKFFQARTNRTIKNLIELEESEGMTSPALAYIREPNPEKTRTKKGEGLFRPINDLKSNQQLRYELQRIRHFLEQQTSTVEGTRKYFEHRKKEMVNIAKSVGYNIYMKDLTVDDIDKFYELYRSALEKLKDYDSTQIKDTVYNVYKDMKQFIKTLPEKMVTPAFNKLIDTKIKDLLKEKYEESIDEDEEEGWNPFNISN